MVVDIFQNDTIRRMRSVERFAIFKEEKVRLIADISWHFRKGTKTPPLLTFCFQFAKTKIQLT